MKWIFSGVVLKRKKHFSLSALTIDLILIIKKYTYSFYIYLLKIFPNSILLNFII